MSYLVFIVICFAALITWVRQERNLDWNVSLVPKSLVPLAYENTKMAVYDQFILFGDSLIQHSSSQERGFSLTPALQSGTCLRHGTTAI